MIDYSDLIQTKYGLLPSPVEGQPGTFVLMYNPEPVIVWWGSELPQPTLAELDEYAVSPEYLAAWGAKLKVFYNERVNDWANEKVIAAGILLPQQFYNAMVANIGFLSQKWVRYGRPATLDPLEFIVIHAEAQAYRDGHAGSGDAESQMSAYALAGMQESRWQDMQNGFASIVYVRRLALEQIKLMPVNDLMPNLLEDLVANLDIVLQQSIAGLQQMQQQILAEQQAE